MGRGYRQLMAYWRVRQTVVSRRRNFLLTVIKRDYIILKQTHTFTAGRMAMELLATKPSLAAAERSTGFYAGL
jgi:hypothetical protein